MFIAYVGLGSNLADPRLQVERALAALAGLPHTRVAQYSRLYRSAPWGMAQQPEFINAVAELATELSPRALLEELLAIERRFGRMRDRQRWGPRVIDLDLLLYADHSVDEPGLHLPHPHMHERAFVLLPLAEIAPMLELPEYGSLSVLIKQVDRSSCHVLQTP